MDHIKVWVGDSNGRESVRTPFDVVCTLKREPSNLYVLAIGSTQYVKNRLTTQTQDANRVAQAFKEHGGYFANVSSTIISSDASVDGITLSALENYKTTVLSHTKTNDLVVIYLSGHGTRSGGSYFFCQNEEAMDDPPKSGLSYDAIEDLFDGIPARYRLILLDTCQSGEGYDPLQSPMAKTSGTSDDRVKSGPVPIHPTMDPLDSADMVLKEIFNDLNRGTGSLDIAASGSRENLTRSTRGRATLSP